MNAPLKYVHIGVGGFGQHWCKEFLPRLSQLGLAVPIAAVDIDAEVLKKAKDQLGLKEDQLFTSAKQALDSCKPDFVTIVVPPSFHEEMVDLALSRGCHILSEKPIADTMEASCRIYRKVSRADRKMAVTMSHRFDQDKQSLEAAIKSGKYGALNYVVHRFTHNCRAYGSWGAKFRHEIPDPLLIEGTVHHFDMLRALTGSNAKKVYAVTWNPPWGEYKGDSTGLITIEMENGVKCMYEGAKANASSLNGWGYDYMRAECSDGTLELDRRSFASGAADLGSLQPPRSFPLSNNPRGGTRGWLRCSANGSWEGRRSRTHSRTISSAQRYCSRQYPLRTPEPSWMCRLS